jgi:hypothetical protein
VDADGDGARPALVPAGRGCEVEVMRRIAANPWNLAVWVALTWWSRANAQNLAVITSPANGATVSGKVTIATQESTTVSWINVYADGVWFASNSPTASRPYSVIWNSTTVANGAHTIAVKSYNSSNHLLGATSIVVMVANGAAPSASATPKPTPTATRKPTASPTRAATRTPTRTPSRTPTRTPVPSPTAKPSASPTPTPAPAGAVYYVSPTGSDSAAGTSGAPWRTVQHAVNVLRAGQTAVVQAGAYAERVLINSSGSAGSPITIVSAGGADVKLRGFELSGSYWIVDGFDISTQANGTAILSRRLLRIQRSSTSRLKRQEPPSRKAGISPRLTRR